MLYGTNSDWGNASAGNPVSGNVFRMNMDGTDYQILRQFAGVPDFGPSGALAFDGSTIYGTVTAAGPTGHATNGFVYAMDLDGSNYRTVYAFTGVDTALPQTGVVLDGSTLYGTTMYGSVFKVDTDGSGYQVLASVPATFGQSSGIMLSDSTLYGVTISGGANGLGTIYKVNTDGSGYEVLHSFAGGVLDGSNPQFVDLVTDGFKLFGTTSGGGTDNNGTVFSIDFNGANYHVLHAFSGSDGADPLTGLTLVGSSLYGVTGGALGIFRINTDGTGFESLYQAPPGDKQLRYPLGPLTSGGPNVFYGTTNGLSASEGTVFMFTVPEPSGWLLFVLGALGLARFRRTKRG